MARRTFTWFVLLSMLPLGITGFVTIQQVSAYLVTQTNKNLADGAKNYGLQVYARLSLAIRMLEQADRTRWDTLTQSTPWGDDSYFDAVGRLDGSRRTLLTGDARRLPSVAADLHPLGAQRIWIGTDRTGHTSIYLLRRIATVSGAPVLIVAALNRNYLWQPIKISELYSLCVRTAAGVELFCSDDVNNGAVVSGRGDRTDYLSGTWQLFMQAVAGVEDWVITARRPEASSLATVDIYKRTLVLSILGALALIALLGSINIRRSHEPLERMIDATRRIASGGFDEPLNVQSGDEYEELARAINEMGAKIGRQIDTLSALGQIDRRILDSSSLEQIVETVLTRARAVLDCDLAAVLLIDAEADTKGRLYWVDRAYTDGPRMSRVAWPQLTELENVAEQSVVIDRNARGAVALQALWDEGVEHCYVLPVTAKSRVKALFLLGYRARTDRESSRRELVRDFTDRLAVALTSAEREQALFYQAHYDSLTRLPNRLLFKDRLEQELAHARNEATQVALVFIDLDRFKNINDSLGHTAGDQLLMLAAARLSRELRDIDTIARLGGDEFTVIVPQTRGSTEIARLCERMLRSLTAPFVLDGNDYFVSASMGVALYPDSGNSVEELLRNADTAMYRAKSQARGSFAFYEESMNHATRERVWIEGQLRQALANDTLELWYQPQIDLRSGKIVSAEALLRWRHPERGIILPAAFIPIAEETGLIVQIGEWVVESACRQLKAWQRSGLELQSISVNVAVPQLQAPGFTEFVLRALHEHSIASEQLELEVTESVMAADIVQVGAVLRELNSAGVRLAIDDFGTGYSSLSYLQRMPFHTLKIDRAFIPRLFDGNDQLICDAVLALAAALHKTVVAEGVETAEQLLYLQDKGCHIGQGRFFSMPVAVDEFAALLAGDRAGITMKKRVAL